MLSLTKIAKQFFDFIGYSNLFLAIAVFASTIQTIYVFTDLLEASASFAFLNFMASFFLYNLQRIYQSTKPTTDERLLLYRRNKKWIFTIALIFILSFSNTLLQIAFQFYQGIVVYAVCGVISLIYFLPPFQLRKVKLMKQFSIAFIWVMVCSVIPFLYSGYNYVGWDGFTSKKMFYILAQFCFISALCVPFDIRDYEKDKREGTNSIPVVLGIKASKLIAIALVLIYFALAFLMQENKLIIVRLIIGILSALVILASNGKRHRYYFIYLADGVILLQSILLYFL